MTMHQQGVIGLELLRHVFRHVVLQSHHGCLRASVQERQLEDFELGHDAGRESGQRPGDVDNTVAHLLEQLRIGLVPKQHSSGGKDRLGSISKQGDRYLRSLFVAGALSVIRYAKIHGTKHRPWLTALLARRPTKVAAIALANKLARMAWAMMARGERYRNPVALAA